MSYSRRLIPSTSMLMAFDSAARTGSFTAAARELNLTQGAISRQINALENQLSVHLFQRERKSVILTDVGRLYAQEVQTILQAIRNASLTAMSNPLSGVLNLAILPTFGTRWLMPRLPQFLQQNPDITVNFLTKLSPFDFRNENLHAAIHYGSPDWPGTSSTFLMSEETIPVCSPKLLQDTGNQTPPNLATLPIMHLATRPNAWNQWFQANNMEPPAKAEQGMVFEQFSLVIQAAIAGLGAALLPKFLIQHELDSVELITITDVPAVSHSDYYLVTPVEKLNYPPIMAFRNWLLETVNG